MQMASAIMIVQLGWWGVGGRAFYSCEGIANINFTACLYYKDMK